MSQNATLILEGFLSNISRANKFKNIKDLRNQRDAYRNFTTPEGFKLNFKADVLNTGAQALRKNKNATIAMNRFQNETRINQPKYIDDSYNRMGFGGLKMLEQMARDNFRKNQLRENMTKLPIKRILLEDSDFLNNENFEKLRTQNEIWKENNPDLQKADTNKLFYNLRKVLHQPTNFDAAYPVKSTNTMTKLIFPENETLNNPTAIPLFKHLNSIGNQYEDAEKYINNLPKLEQDKINNELIKGNQNIGIPNDSNFPYPLAANLHNVIQKINYK